jgi:hypothetical protein
MLVGKRYKGLERRIKQVGKVKLSELAKELKEGVVGCNIE